MKKTLAAVLAAAMALSTATVAFAADSQDVTMGGTTSTDTKEKDTTDGVKMGDTSKFVLGDVEGFNGREVGKDGAKIDAKSLAELIDDGVIKPTVVVSSGKSSLASSPVVKVVKDEAQLQFKIAHTYGTKDVKVTMKVKLTLAKDLYLNEDGDAFTTKKVEGQLVLKKGDSLVGEEVTYKAAYDQISSYGDDMTITIQEVKDNNVLAKGEELYTNADSDSKATIYFDNYAAFSSKISAAQKDINLYYSVDEIEEVVKAYPDVDFEFITFKGKPSFNNSGEMTFNAIGGKNTTVYSFDGETLQPLSSTYDSTYGTVTVKGIKKLDRFVVASEVLEVEEEEEEPASSETEAPSVEKEDKNPNTGAC